MSFFTFKIINQIPIAIGTKIKNRYESSSDKQFNNGGRAVSGVFERRDSALFERAAEHCFHSVRRRNVQFRRF